ncbi:hypothetical protein Ddc_15053 [Ditylenchus destructor]|nr:hypothetical protein Ddc_15053 [Ditylenchus destructor]
MFGSKRFLYLNAAMLKPHKEDRRSDWWDEIVQVTHSLVEQIKKRFLAAKTSEEKREFYLELDGLGVFSRCGIQDLEPFDIQNDATNERLTFGPHSRTCAYTLWRKSA